LKGDKKMIITLKSVKRRYILTADGKRFTFKDGLWAWSFANDAHKYGVDYACEVYDKIRCLYHLGLLKKGDDKKEANVRKMLLGYESSILMDNAVRGILVGDYTLNDLLKRKGF
jgi:hypothetical protein